MGFFIHSIRFEATALVLYVEFDDNIHRILR
jgi:hypothetical protein